MFRSEKQHLPVLVVFLLLTVQLASNVSVEALCEREVGYQRPRTMFARIAWIVMVPRKRGVFASNCMSDHLGRMKQTDRSNSAP